MTYLEPDPIEFTPPTVEQLRRLTAFHRFWFKPEFFGLEQINPGKPCMLVGNHTIYGLIDVIVLIEAIWRERGVMIRGLADHMQFAAPGWRDFVASLGIVHGTRENCRRLMEHGETVLVFPGGAREVAKRKGESYQLTWKKRTGFARMAIEAGYDIVPFGAVGPDHCLDVVIDANDVEQSLAGTALKRTGIWEKYLRNGDIVMPVTRGIGPTPIPRPERFYFELGEPIDTTRFAGLDDDAATLWQLRGEVEQSIEKLLGHLLLVRERDTERRGWRRWLTR